MSFIPTQTPVTRRPKHGSKKCQAAYDVIGDDDKRARYDEVRKMGPIGPMFGGGPGPGPGTGNFNVGMDDIGDLLGGLFNRGGRGRGQPGATQGQRGSDLEVDLTLDFG